MQFLGRKKKIFLALLYFLFLAGVAEGLSFFVIRQRNNSYATAASLFKTLYYQGEEDKDGCFSRSYIESHPFLAYSYRRSGKCSRKDVNSYGFIGPEFPESRDPESFTILVLGGSFAELSTIRADGEPASLEKVLNRDFISPNGKPFRVLNGSMVGGRQPMQTNALTLFADLVDAAVSIEGRGESLAYGEVRRIAATMMQPRGATFYREDLFRYFFLFKAQDLFYFFQSNPVLHHSYFCYLLSSSLIYFFAQQNDLTSLTFPGLPSHFTLEQRKEHFLAEYSKYLQSMRAIAQEHGLKLAIFFQPVPAIGKKLTAEELSLVGNLDYAKNYQEMTDKLLELRKERIPIYSLLNTFNAITESIYVDSTHLRNDRTMPGYFLVAEAMSRVLASEWRLKPKRSQSL